MVIENLECAEIKTKAMNTFLNAVEAGNKPYVITPEVRKNVVLSTRNIPGAKTATADIINVYDILNSGKLVIDRDAVAKIQEVFGK